MPADSRRLQTTDYRIGILIFVSVIFLFFAVVSSQLAVVKSLTPLEQAQSDYSFQLSKYEDSKERFISAVANHKAFNTAVSKNEEFIKTKDFLIQANNVYITYLLLIEERSNLYDWGKGIYKKDDEHRIIDAEIQNLERYKTQIESTKTLEEATPYFDILKNHVENETLPIASRFLTKTDISQLYEAKYDFENTAEKVETYLNGKVSDKDRQLYLNWQSQVDATLQKINSALQIKVQDLNTAGARERIKFDQDSFKFNTDAERGMFTETDKLLREIVEVI